MFINNRMTSLIYKLVLIVVCIIGLIMNSGLATGTFAPYVLLYYTIMSNLFCLVFYIISAIVTGVNIHRTGKSGIIRFAPHFKGAVVMSMMLTTIIYFFVLFDGSFENSSTFALFANIIGHFVVPIMVLVDWALFDRKGRFAPADPLIWLSVPFLYYAIVLIMAEPHLVYVTYYGGVHYPYRFINPELQGSNWAMVLVNVFLLTAIYTAVGYILFGVDRVLGNQAKKKAMAATASALPASPDIDNADELNSLDDLMHMDSAPGAVVAAAAQAAQPAQPVVTQPAAQAAQPAQPVTAQPAAPAQAPAQPYPAAPGQTVQIPGQAPAVQPGAPIPPAQQAAQAPMQPRPAAPGQTVHIPGQAQPPVTQQPAPAPAQPRPVAPMQQPVAPAPVQAPAQPRPATPGQTVQIPGQAQAPIPRPVAPAPQAPAQPVAPAAPQTPPANSNAGAGQNPTPGAPS